MGAMGKREYTERRALAPKSPEKLPPVVARAHARMRPNCRPFPTFETGSWRLTLNWEAGKN
jgi:hypothetical protein